MPALDMNMKDMEKYLGQTIKPRDFDLFWKKQKDLADNLELDYRITNKNFNNNNGNYYEINFRGIDGANIYAKYIRPNTEEKVPTVLECHDYKKASRSWHHLTRYIGVNYSVVAMDCRGQGGKSKDLGNIKGSTVCGHLINGLDDVKENMYYCKVYLDGYILSRIVEELEVTDKSRMIAFGKGQGAAIALVVSSLNKNIKKCSMQYPFLCDFKRVYDMDLDVDAYEGLRYYFRWFDPMHLREKEVFEKLGYIDIVNFANKLNCEILMGTALLDTICPPSTQYAVYNNLNCDKKHIIFPKYDHELNNFFENENLKFIRFL